MGSYCNDQPTVMGSNATRSYSNWELLQRGVIVMGSYCNGSYSNGELL